jgi:ubiquinone/menaquinone biosynthesis C-methylase UbiE
MIRNLLRNRWRGSATPPSPPTPEPAPVTKVLTRADKTALLDRYAHYATTAYATARDYCDSAEHLPDLMYFNGDLKDVQRPWALKAVLGCVPPGAHLVEIGAGEPRVATALVELGYQVTVVDPYDGAGNGPTEYAHYAHVYRQVRLLRERFGPALPLAAGSIDAVYSISVLEHLPEAEIAETFAALKYFLRPGGYSIHCIDSVIAGQGTEFHAQQCQLILQEQAHLAAQPADAQAYARLLQELQDDLESFYLSAEGHQLWRRGLAMSYQDFPFRKVISLQTCVQRPLAE